MVGDVTVSVVAETWPDGDPSNNRHSVESYVHVGGTGFGAALPCVIFLVPCAV
jgi:hypothetical protein